MATNTRNVIVGAANLFLSNKNGANRPTTTPADIAALLAKQSGAGVSARTGINASTANGGFREVGFTSTGLDISYEPNYGDVVVDQLLDAARIFKQSLKVMLKTELVEATLENLTTSWSQSDYYTDASGNPVWSLQNQAGGTIVPAANSSIIATASKTAILNMAAGAIGDSPVERVLIAVGSAPQQIGSKYDPSQSSGAGGTTNLPYSSDLKQKERVYIARRVINIDTTAHGLKRDAATVFPVNFRCLPDDSDASYTGSEYGVIIDRVWGTI
jgi:hypothetical protein